MEVAVIGINHNLSPIKIREKVTFTEAKKIEATTILTEKEIEEVIILSTCNRSEIYVASDNIEKAVSVVENFFVSYFKDKSIDNYVFSKIKDEAVYHIFEVCAGLDSIVIGEDQILGQVKDALITSIELKGSSKILNKLFREAITLAKKIKTETKVSDNPLSISYIGVKKLRDKIKDLSDKKVLVIGIGKMGILALTHIREYGTGQIFICNRKLSKSIEISEKIKDIQVVKFENFKDIIRDVDIIISATSSPHVIIKEEYIDKNRTKPLYILDLAMPRDVDENLKNINNIFLFDVDSLKIESEENKIIRENLLKDSKTYIDESIREFNLWKSTIKADKVLESMYKKCNHIKSDTLSYIYRKTDLSCRDKKIIEKMVESSLKRLMREMVLNLKDTKEEKKLNEYVKVLNELFEF